IPQYNLKELDNDLEIPELDNVEYKNLHQATLNAINNKTEQANKSIGVLRDRAINNLYRDLNSDLVKRYLEIESLYNYSVEGSEFNNIYRSEEHTSELQSRFDLVCRLLLEKKK